VAERVGESLNSGAVNRSVELSRGKVDFVSVHGVGELKRFIDGAY